MRQRRQIAGGADGALRRDPRINFRIDQRRQRTDHAQTNAGKPTRGLLIFNTIIRRTISSSSGWPTPPRATAPANAVNSPDRAWRCGSAPAGKPGINAVGGAPLRHNRLHAGHAVVNGTVGAFIKGECHRLTPDVTQLFERQRAGSKC